MVGWSISHNPTAALTSNALGRAIEQRDAHRGETVIHSDHGTQFTSWAFTERARQSGLVPSMGSVGDCYDNAMIDSFWSRMQVELLDTRRWCTRVDLANAIFKYIEIFHNRSAATRASACEHRSNMKQQRLPESRNATPPNPGHCEVSVKTGMAQPLTQGVWSRSACQYLSRSRQLASEILPTYRIVTPDVCAMPSSMGGTEHCPKRPTIRAAPAAAR